MNMGYEKFKPAQSFPLEGPGCRRTLKRRVPLHVRRFLYWIFGMLILLFVLDWIWKHWGEIDVKDEKFEYSGKFAELPAVVEMLGQRLTRSSDVLHANKLFSSVDFVHSGVKPFDDHGPYGLLIIVKSALENRAKRNAIRKTWGDLECLEAVPLSPNLPSKLMFITGIPSHSVQPNATSSVLEQLFPEEWMLNDTIVANFVDSYENNTYKSILAMKWATFELSSGYKYLFLVDDDMYIDLENLVWLLRSLPDRAFEKKYEKSTGPQFPYYRMSSRLPRNKNLTLGDAIIQNGLYMGKVYPESLAMRRSLFQFGRSAWMVSMEEYPYNYYPPYVPGAAIVFSEEAVRKMYYGSMFVKPFKIDDVYIGILAKKVGLIPIHNSHFYAWYLNGKLAIDDDLLFEAIAIHGLQCPAQMIDLWVNRDPLNLKDCD